MHVGFHIGAGTMFFSFFISHDSNAVNAPDGKKPSPIDLKKVNGRWNPHG